MVVSVELARLRDKITQLEFTLAAADERQLPGLLNAIGDVTRDSIMLLDRQQRIRYINRTAPGLTPSDVLGAHPTEFVPPPYDATIRACFERVLSHGRSDQYETVYLADNGSVSLWEAVVAPIRRGGDIDGLAVVASDVTERRADAAERDRLFCLSLDLFCVATTSGYFKRVNPAFTSVLGFSAAELTAVPFLDFVHPDDRVRTEECFAALLAGQDAVDFENRYRCRDGSYRWLEWRSAPDLELGLIFAVARDVTERRALEQSLHNAHKMEAIGRLAGGVAHDFNNVLCAISVSVALAERGEADALTCARHAVDQGARLARQLLSFGRPEPGERQTVELGERLRRLIDMLRAMLPDNVLTTLACDDAPPVRVDINQIELVVVNLCINARDAMPLGGQLHVRLSEKNLAANEARTLGVRAGCYASIEVTDTGEGMPDAVLQQVFEPFYTTKSADRGTGLGLSTSRDVVRKHGGEIRARSEPGRGSTFEILLPAERLARGTLALPELSDAEVGGSETILVAEDAAPLREAVARLLEGAGYRVVQAANGRDAVQHVRERPGEIAVAVLDVVMPDLGGVEAAAAIRRLDPAIELIYTTSHPPTDHTGDHFDVPGDLLAKPWTPGALLARVRSAADRAQRPQA